MNFIYSDFSLLFAASGRNNTLFGVLKAIISDEGYVPSYGQICGGIVRLSAVGFLNYDENIFTLTEKGYAFLSSGKKFLEGRQHRKKRLETALYEQFNLSEQEMFGKNFEGRLPIDTEFAASVSSAMLAQNLKSITPSISLSVTDDLQTFTFPGLHTESDDITDEDFSAEKTATFECPFIDGYSLVEAFASAVFNMADTCAPRRQICLPCIGGRSHVLTLSRTADGSIRVSIANIRFNGRRFTGLADGDLDYAQCGERSVDFTIDAFSLAQDTAVAVASITCGTGFGMLMQKKQFPFDTLRSLHRLTSE